MKLIDAILQSRFKQAGRYSGMNDSSDFIFVDLSELKSFYNLEDLLPTNSNTKQVFVYLQRTKNWAPFTETSYQHINYLDSDGWFPIAPKRDY
jgi:hypothetical protein